MNKKKMRWIPASLAVMIMFVLIMGCSKSSTNEGTDVKATDVKATAGTSEEILKLRYVIPGTAQPNQDEVVKLVNDKLKADGVNVQLELKFIPWDAWDQKSNLMLSTGEEFEMLHVMENGAVPAAAYVGRGALQPLDELIDKYGPVLKELIPSYAWDAAKVNGKIYSVPAQWRLETASSGELGTLGIRKDLLDKANVQVPKTADEFIAAAEAMQKASGKQSYIQTEMDVTPVFLHRTYDSWPFYVDYREQIAKVDQTGKVSSWLESDEFKQDAKVFRELYTKKLINPDILTFKTEERNKAMELGDFTFTTNAALYAAVGIKKNNPTAVIEEGYLAPEKSLLQFLAFGNTNAVPVTAKHPEAAIKFLNWLYSSKENHNLFLYGAEGKQYTAVGERKADFIKDKDNQPYYFPSWMIGNVKFMLFDKDVPDAYLKVQTEAPDMKVDLSTVIGFHLNSEPIAVEYANVLSEIKSKIIPIKMGVQDYDKYFPAALASLKAAGLDKVIAEYDKQFKEFQASKKK
ncbi:extracellular solute-binding protein [Paenibacillus psychroresistens]|uniref:Extracellular solute-binding protein n=1 Tax=Paenibacillus psychroresistens TaxID=1778678 RepID=A0A6B8RF78_9BACL|nr:extracellular solute-binding protein [Paenibacillus psychroresistens]QGQ95141.1 extracellular solute-binding protein [Paenibacillus psychroresistens]